MTEKIITPYDMALTEILVAYNKQGAQAGKIAFVTGFDLLKDLSNKTYYQCLNAYDFESRENLIIEHREWETNGLVMLRDLVEYEVREGKNVLTRNLTGEFKSNILSDFDRAYRVVFGEPKGNGK